MISVSQLIRPVNYTVIDLEMTGLSAKTDKILEIGAVRVRGGKIVDTYGMLVNPHVPIVERITELTGITNEMAASGMEPDEAVQGLLDFIGEDVIVGQNVTFDYSFLKQWAVNHKRKLEMKAYDTLKIARKLLPSEQPKNLEALCTYYGIKRENAHRALDDAIETQELFEKLLDEVMRIVDDHVAGQEASGAREDGGTNPEAGKKDRDAMKESLACANYVGENLEAGKKDNFKGGLSLGKAQLESILTPKPLQYKAKRQTPATKHQIERLKEFRETYGITEAINWESLTRSEASRIQDRYRATYLREDNHVR